MAAPLARYFFRFLIEGPGQMEIVRQSHQAFQLRNRKKTIFIRMIETTSS